MVRKAGVIFRTMQRKAKFSRWIAISVLMQILVLSGCPSPVGGDDDNDETQTYAVTYDANGATSGSVPSAQTKTHGVALTLATNSGSLARTGYTFTGWNSKNDGTGEDYAESASYSTDAGLILYAKWALITYSVTYDANGATSGSIPSAQTKAHGVALTLATNNGNLADTYFAGWNTSPDGTGADYAEGASYTIDAPLKLYAKWQSYSVGETGPAGGIVFYDKGSHSEGWRYMEAAPEDFSNLIAWWNGQELDTGATATSIGSGETNTATIVAVQGEGIYAASLCFDLVLGGYDDWFLPSKDEIHQMFVQKDSIGDFNSRDPYANWYWSSTEYTFNAAWAECFDDDADYRQMCWSKRQTGAIKVRAIRSF